MIVLKKFATLFLWVFVILPIYEARFYHGYNSYKQYYNNKIKYPAINNILKQTNHDHNEIQKEVNRFKGDNNHVDFIFSHNNRFQMRNDINNNAKSIKNPTPCNNESFCEDSIYPQEYADDILLKNPMLKFDISEQKVKFDGNLDYNSCKSESRSICPHKAKTINGIWMWIIQSTQYKQLISYVSCEEGIEGSLGTKNNQCQYVSTNDNLICKQMSSEFSLLAFNSSKYEMAVFKFPSYCCCNCRQCD